jgi:hypothetical protein
VATAAEARRSTFVVQKIIGTYDLLRIAKLKTRNQPAKGPEDGGPNNQKSKAAIAAFAASVGAGDVGGKMSNAKSIGWTIYAAGLVIWLFGYLSTGHVSAFDWKMATPWWVSSFVPNLEAELGLALMFGSMIPIYGCAVRKRA